MVVRRLCSLVLALLVAPGLAWAAPQGKIVIAQARPGTTSRANTSEHRRLPIISSLPGK